MTASAELRLHVASKGAILSLTRALALDHAPGGIRSRGSDSNYQRPALADHIIGCPHEEGIDYPEGG
ncbi:MAG TPA: hypothetical protein VF283_05605, partial [Bryobacteraceae bacterium]